MTQEEIIVIHLQQMLFNTRQCKIDVVYTEGVGALFWREGDPHNAQHVIHVHKFLMG